MTGNDFMSWVLRSPFHGMLSNGMMLITVTGCKTGKKYTTPVGFYESSGFLWILTSRNRTWWKNLRGKAEVDLLLRRKPVKAFAELELDDANIFAVYRRLQNRWVFARKTEVAAARMWSALQRIGCLSGCV